MAKMESGDKAVNKTKKRKNCAYNYTLTVNGEVIKAEAEMYTNETWAFYPFNYAHL